VGSIIENIQSGVEGIKIDDSTMSMINSIFKNFSTSIASLARSKENVIKNSSFENSQLGLYLLDSDAQINDSTFRYLGTNSSLGGAVRPYSSYNIKISNCLFDSNIAL